MFKKGVKRTLLHFQTSALLWVAPISPNLFWRLLGLFLLCLSVYLLSVFFLSVSLFICQSVRLFVSLSVYISVCLYFCLCICLSVYISVCLYFCLCICLSVYFSVCVFVCLFIFLSVHYCLSFYLSVYLFVCLYVFFFSFSVYVRVCFQGISCSSSLEGAQIWAIALNLSSHAWWPLNW
jgi:hypothetical protein